MKCFFCKKDIRVTSQALLREQLIRHEEYRRFAYTDSEGYLTAGIGRCLDKDKGKGLSRQEAEYLLDNDIQEVTKKLQLLNWYKNLSSVRKCIIVNMAFNMGIHGILKFKKMIKAIESKNFSLASVEMLNSKWANQVGKRAIELSEQMRTDVFDITVC